MKAIASVALLVVLCFITFGAVSYRGAGVTFNAGGIFPDLAASRLARERIQQDGETARTRIQAETSRANMPYVALTVVALAAGAVGIAWSRRPHKPAPLPPMRLLSYQAQYPGTEICIVDGQWSLIDASDRYRTLAQLETMERKRIAQQA